ncbi:MAG: hypothetical protein Q9218_006100, partial [Villophora microphyllina]
MAQASPIKLHWSKKLHHHVAQAKHCASTGNFAYFHAARLQYITTGIDHAATLKAQDVPQDDLDRLNGINISTTESCETSTTELEKDVKAIQVDDKLPEAVKKAEWTKKLTDKNEVAKKKVTDAMDAGLEEAISLISAMPESSQDSAADFFLYGMNIAMEAFDFMIQKISQLYNAVVDFMKKIWTALTAVWNAVSDQVSSCVRKLFGFRGSSYNTEQYQSEEAGTRYTAALSYNAQIPIHAMRASTNKIWNEYRNNGGTFVGGYTIAEPSQTPGG